MEVTALTVAALTAAAAAAVTTLLHQVRLRRAHSMANLSLAHKHPTPVIDEFPSSPYDLMYDYASLSLSCSLPPSLSLWTFTSRIKCITIKGNSVLSPFFPCCRRDVMATLAVKEKCQFAIAPSVL